MPYKRLVALTVAAIIVTAFSVLPVDARAKKKTKYRADTTTLSLDGRNTGRARTCGFDTFLYDGLGVPPIEVRLSSNLRAGVVRVCNAAKRKRIKPARAGSRLPPNLPRRPDPRSAGCRRPRQIDLSSRWIRNELDVPRG
jgi:hypothetical protein